MTFNIFVQQARPRDAFPVLISLASTACSAIQFRTEMYFPKTYKTYKKRACLLRTDEVIRVFTVSRPKSHRVQWKFEDPFSAGCLASSPLTALYVCRH